MILLCKIKKGFKQLLKEKSLTSNLQVYYVYWICRWEQFCCRNDDMELSHTFCWNPSTKSKTAHLSLGWHINKKRLLKKLSFENVVQSQKQKWKRERENGSGSASNSSDSNAAWRWQQILRWLRCKRFFFYKILQESLFH